MFDFSRPLLFRNPKFLVGFKKKPELFLVLDIGTEAVKVLIFKLKNVKIVILGSSLRYFDRFSVFNSRDFETDVIEKAVSKAVKEVQEETGLKTDFTFLGLPANILKGRVVFQPFIRKNPEKVIDEKEENEIYQKIFPKAQKEIFQEISQKYGILADDLHFTSLKILEIKIDGYRVPSLGRYNGKNLNFRILATFLPKYSLKSIENIAQRMDFKNKILVQKAQGLTFWRGLNEIKNGIFLDIGGEITQIFLAKNGLLERINEFAIGGMAFSQILSERLGLSDLRARVLKESYSPSPSIKGGLSQETKERIKEFLWLPVQTWFRNLKDKLREIKSLLPETIYLFGGGSLIPEIEEVLTEGNWEGLPFVGRPKIKSILPRDLKDIDDQTKKLNSPQDIPPLLLCFCYQDGKKNF